MAAGQPAAARGLQGATVALTIPQLAYALRLIAEPTDSVDAGVTLDLTRMQSVATAYIELDTGTRAPETVRDEAQRLFVGYLYDGPDFNPGGAAVSYVDAWRQSGAQALLSRWRIHRVGFIGTPTAGGGGAAAGTGLDRTALVALIDQRIAASGGNGMPTSGGTGLNAQQLADLQSSIDREGISIDGRTIEFIDHEGRMVNIEVPGVTVLDESTILLSGEGAGSANQVDELVFLGANVTAARIGNRVNVTIGGLTTAQVNALITGHAQFRELAQFEDALRTQTTLQTNFAVAVAASDAAYRMGSLAKVPPAGYDRELLVRVGTGFWYVINVNTLRAKPTVSQGDQLNDTNAVGYTEGDDQWWFARESGTNNLLFGSDNVGTHRVSLQDSQIDLSTWARRSNADVIPDAKLPARAAWTVPGSATLIPTNRLEAKVGEVLDAFSDAGWAEEGSDAKTDALIGANFFERNTIPTIVEASGEYQRRRPHSVATALGATWVTIAVPDAFPDEDIARGWLRVGAVYDNNPEQRGEQFTSDTWSFLGDYTSPGGAGRLPAGKYQLYAKQFTAIPGGTTLTIYRYSPFRLNTDDVEVPGLSDVPPLQAIHAGPITGMTITSTTADVTTAMTVFSPTFDLDSYGFGELHALLRLTLINRADVNQSFGEAGAPAVTETRFTGLIFLSELKASDAFVPAGDLEGIKVGSATIRDRRYAGSLPFGTVSLYLTRNANNEVGYYLHYDGNIGQSARPSTNFSLSARLELSLSVTDAAAAPAPTGGGGGVLTKLGSWSKAAPTSIQQRQFVSSADAKLPDTWTAALVVVTALRSTANRSQNLASFWLTPGNDTYKTAQGLTYPMGPLGPYSLAGGASPTYSYPMVMQLDYGAGATLGTWDFHARKYGDGAGMLSTAAGWTVTLQVWYATA